MIMKLVITLYLVDNTVNTFWFKTILSLVILIMESVILDRLTTSSNNILISKDKKTSIYSYKTYRNFNFTFTSNVEFFNPCCKAKIN